MASIFSILHGYQLRQREKAFRDPSIPNPTGSFCFAWGGDLLVVGIIANYAVVAADTFSSELGILAKGEPRLITSLNLRKVPRGTNGGVTLMGLGAGLLGSMVIVTASMVFTPLCSGSDESTGWTTQHRGIFMWGLTIWGLLGSIVDSVLGGLFQRTVKDARSGKIVEAEGGGRVLVSTIGGRPDPKILKTAGIKASLLHGEGADAIEETEAVEEDSEATGANKGKKGKKRDKYDPKDKTRKPSFGDAKPTRVVENGWDLLDNNDVNFLMAFIMSISAMVVAGLYWNIPLKDAFYI
jgi:uncharacterized membrane protein